MSGRRVNPMTLLALQARHRSMQRHGMQSQSAQPVQVPSEYTPPDTKAAEAQAVPPPAQPDQPTNNMVDSNAIITRLNKLEDQVALLRKMQFKQYAKAKTDLPLFRQKPETIAELIRGKEQARGDEIVAADSVVLLSHPHEIGADGLVFMRHYRIDSTTGEVTERFVPIGLSRQSTEADKVLNTANERIFFSEFDWVPPQ